MERRWDLDALRGLMLVLMTVTHLPTRLAEPMGQPLGFVSAAEGFVFLSAFMAGLVYTRRAQRGGPPRLAEVFWRRALKLYAVQAALMLFLFSVVASIGVRLQQEAVLGMLGFYFERPRAAVVAGLTLLYNPPLLDILPMYIVFMVVSPMLLLHALRHGWAGIVIASLSVWVAAHLGLGAGVQAIVTSLSRAVVPVGHTGAFDLFAWQFLWAIGLWLGALQAIGDPGASPRFPPWMVASAWVWLLVCLVWRHGVGQTPFPGDPPLNLLFDKWQLGPLRLLNFFALLLLAMHHGAWLKAHLPRVPVLETLGAAALPVFCAHLVATLVALTAVGAPTSARPWTVDAAVLIAAFASLWLVAVASGWAERRTAAWRQRVNARRSTWWRCWARRRHPDARRSPSARSHNPLD